MRKFGVAILAAAAVTLGAGAASAQIKLAINGPMTGQYANFGEQFKRGGEMAIADLNAKGGVMGQKLSIVIGDDACDPKQAREVANKTVQQKVAAVIGHFCSGSSIPASEVYKEENLIQISPASTNPVFTDRGLKNTFRVCGRDDQQGTVAADFMLDKFKGKKVAIVHDKSQYGKGLADEFKKRYNSKGAQEVLYEAVSQGDKDFSALVSKLKANNADAVFFGGYHTEAGLIVRQSREQGLNATYLSGDALVDQQFWSIAGKAGEGMLMTFDADPRKIPANKPMVDKFKAQGFDPEGYTFYTYAAIQVYAQAVERAKSTKFADVEKQMRSGKFQTVLGDLSFDAKGDVTTAGYRVYVWKDGKYDYLN